MRIPRLDGGPGSHGGRSGSGLSDAVVIGHTPHRRRVPRRTPLRRSRRRLRWGKGELASPGRVVRPSPAGRESVSSVASSNEKDVETMPTQKIFKQRVRTRMAKTGESYTAARRQLMQKADRARGDRARRAAATAARSADDAELLLTSDEAMRRGSGRGHQEWFDLLDAWGATGHSHTEIARWLHRDPRRPGLVVPEHHRELRAGARHAEPWPDDATGSASASRGPSRSIGNGPSRPSRTPRSGSAGCRASRCARARPAPNGRRGSIGPIRRRGSSSRSIPRARQVARGRHARAAA